MFILKSSAILPTIYHLYRKIPKFPGKYNPKIISQDISRLRVRMSSVSSSRYFRKEEFLY
ncbi:hypothetical protein LEP1GSC050_2259 [Leptospira broomii serovar Hurstbridge str. 5399]|uniref:Uncharacterized protein n=1 Tax=Leptospira broomii serovar Hurstbridge str. 5399 TaxID=1049789 RepID=T0F389_9LEPT|nr:hypothetical protein LEP1GSC050_2259 [Leptospira broomii serovar Hurstbridge str. 5399]